MNAHYAETRAQVNIGTLSDPFAKHFSSHFKEENKKVCAKDIRNITRVEILWQGNPISTMKTFGKFNCKICMNERLQILKASKSIDRDKLINSSHEIYGACRHKSKFHRYRFYDLTSTD